MSNVHPKRRRFGSLIPALGEFKSINSLMDLNLEDLQEEVLLVDANVYEKLQTRLSSIASILKAASTEELQQIQLQIPPPEIPIELAIATPKSDTNTNDVPPSGPSGTRPTLGMVNPDSGLELDQMDDMAIKECTDLTQEISLSEGLSSHDHMQPVAEPVIPAEILRLLTLTGFLATEELGKLLLLTSRSFASSLGDDFCWEMICRCKWSNTGRIPASFIQHQDRGYQWYFHQMSQGEIMEDRPCLGPPSLTLDHLVVLLSIRDGNDSEVYSEILSPHVVEKLVRDGTVTIDLEEPVLAAECSLENNGLFPEHLLPAEKCRNWMASVDFLRLDTHQSCCLHDSCDVEWEYEEDDEYDRHTFTGQDDRYGQLEFAPQLDRLELTDEGRLLERRIQLGDFFKDGLEGTGYQGFRVHVSLLCFQSQTESPDEDDDEDDPSTSMVQFEYRQAKLGVYQLVGDYQPGELLSGNVLLHLWNELLGWDG
jgi:hypothetical protein